MPQATSLQRVITWHSEFERALRSFEGGIVPARAWKLLEELREGGYRRPKTVRPLVRELKLGDPAARLYFTPLAADNWVFVWAGDKNTPYDQTADINKADKIAHGVHSGRKRSNSE